jgi:hypothetical protein
MTRMTRLLSRRQALLALSLSFSGVALSLAGCGGGGGGTTQGAKTRAVRGRIVLPTGSSQSVNDLQLINGFGSTRPNSSGSFTLGIAENTPTIAMALTPAGQLALFGFLDPTAGESQNILDAASAATVLVFLGLGGTQAPIEVKATMLDLIRTDPATATLAQTIGERLVADPLALGVGDSAIQEALKSALETIKAAQGSGKSRSARVTRQESAPVFTLEPVAWQSGVEVLQNPDQDGAILPINHNRRECKLFAYRVGFEDENGVKQELTKADALNNGDSLSATMAIGGLWTTIGELITGSTALVPMKGKSLPLTMRAGDVKTYAEIIVVGSAFTQQEPAFFSEAKYADQVEFWRAARTRLNLISWLRDLVFGLVLEVMGIRSVVADLVEYEALAAAWEEIDDLALRALIGAAKRGELPQALTQLIELAMSNGGIVAVKKLQEKSAVLLATIAGEKAAISETLWTLGFRSLSSLLLGTAGLVMGALDLGAVITDMASANAADRWTATLVKPTVRISPSSQSVSRGKEATLIAQTPGITGKTFVFVWTLTGSNLANMRAEGKAGQSLETTGDRVVVATTPSTEGTLTVKVQAYEVGTGGARTLFGTATATLKMTNASNERVIVTEEYDTGTAPTPAGNFRIAQGFYVFPLADPPVNYYLITTQQIDSTSKNVYRVEARDIGEPVPDDQPITADTPEIPWIHVEGVDVGVAFFRRQNKLYLRFETEGFYGDPARSLASMQAYLEKFEVQFEVVV